MGLTQIELDQCQQMSASLMKEYGWDYSTNREKLPLTKEGLAAIASTPCKTFFKYDDLVKEYCVSVDRFTDQLGDGKTCENIASTSMRAAWCVLDDEGQSEGTRLKTNKKCSKDKLADKYHSTASNFCKSHPRDEWCTCYNFKNKVCDTIPSAAGCKYYKMLEQNRHAFGVEPLIEDPKDSKKKIKGYSDGYNILKKNAHCVPRSCDRGYIPENVKSDCAPSYNFCGEDINIQSAATNSIVMLCNKMGDVKLPDWWDEESESIIGKKCKIDVIKWFNKIKGSKQKKNAPEFIIDFNKFPLNKLSINCLPSKMKWRDSNFRHLTRYTISSSSSLCSILILLLVLLLKRKR